MNKDLIIAKQAEIIDELKSFSPDKDIIDRLESDLATLQSEGEGKEECEHDLSSNKICFKCGKRMPFV